MTRKKRVLHISLDRGEARIQPGRKEWHEEHDERLERALQHPGRSIWALRCHENRCDSMVAVVFETSEGLLWEARVRPRQQRRRPLLAPRELSPSGAPLLCGRDPSTP